MNRIDECAGFSSETRGVRGNVRSAVLVVSERHGRGKGSFIRGQLFGRCVGECRENEVRLTEEYPCPVGTETVKTTTARTFCQDGK